MPKPALNERQRLFVAAYLADPAHSATAAAKAAGYSPRSAKITSHRLLEHAAISAAIRKALEPALRKYGLTKDRVLQEVATLAFSDHADYVVGEDGALGLTATAKPRASRAVAGFERTTRTTERGDDVTTEHRVRLKLWDKPRALEMAMKHLGLLTERVEVTSTGPQTWIVGGRTIVF